MKKQARRAHGAPGSRVGYQHAGKVRVVDAPLPVDAAWWGAFFLQEPETFEVVKRLEELGVDTARGAGAFWRRSLEEDEAGRLCRLVMRQAMAHRARQLKEVIKEG